MKRGTPEHPKVGRLARLLGVRRAEAVGLLECLWHFTARVAPAGDIGRCDNGEIGRGAWWEGEPAALVPALVKAGWLDESKEHRLLIHGWSDHADDGVRKGLQHRGVRRFADGRPVRGTIGRPRAETRQKLDAISPQSDRISPKPAGKSPAEAEAEAEANAEFVSLSSDDTNSPSTVQDGKPLHPPADFASDSSTSSQETSGLVSPDKQQRHSTPQAARGSPWEETGNGDGPESGGVNPKGFSASIFRLLGIGMGDPVQFAADDTTWRRMAQQINGGCLGPPLEAAKRICTVAANFRADPTKRNKAGALVDWFKRQLSDKGLTWCIAAEVEVAHVGG